MSIKDAVVLCYQVLRISPDAIATAYAMPLPEVKAIILAASKRRTGGFPIVEKTNGTTNGAHVNGKGAP